MTDLLWGGRNTGSPLANKYPAGFDPFGFQIVRLKAAADGSDEIDNEHSEYRRIILEGETADLYTATSSKYPKHLIFEKEDYGFFITSYCPVDEMIKIAESIQPKISQICTKTKYKNKRITHHSVIRLFLQLVSFICHRSSKVYLDGKKTSPYTTSSLVHQKIHSLPA